MRNTHSFVTEPFPSAIFEEELDRLIEFFSAAGFLSNEEKKLDKTTLSAAEAEAFISVGETRAGDLRVGCKKLVS